MFSKNALDTFSQNGYAVKIDGPQVLFSKASGYQTLVIIGGIVLSVTVLLSTVRFPVLSLTSTGIILLVTIVLTPRIRGKKVLDLNKESQLFTHYGEDNEFMRNFSAVDEVVLSSEFIDEYASPFKETSEEHEIIIGVRLDSGRYLKLFSFESDFREPTAPIREIFDFFSATFRQARGKLAEG